MGHAESQMHFLCFQRPKLQKPMRLSIYTHDGSPANSAKMGHQVSAITRWRRGSNLARPYIWRLIKQPLIPVPIAFLARGGH